MGQSYKIVNIDKRQYIHPHFAGDGYKLMEFGCSGEGTMMLLAILLASGNGRGGGDLNSDHPAVGSWAGDRIVVAGDYADEGAHVPASDLAAYLALPAEEGAGPRKTPSLSALADDLYENVTEKAWLAVWQDESMRENVAKQSDDYLLASSLREMPTLAKEIVKYKKAQARKAARV